jgi:hypothetical protein
MANSTTATGAKTVTLEIFRYLPDSETEPRYDTFVVPYRKDWVVLDAINWIKDELDETLSYRWSCRMGVCGSCGMMVNGEPKLTCAAFLRDYYPNLTSAEIAEREEFTVEACWAMRDRFLAEEVWETLDFDAAECIEFVKNSEGQRFFRSQLFSRIVPTLRDIGLWGKPVKTAFEQMDVLGLADSDLELVATR